MEISNENQIAILILEKVNAGFNNYLNAEFDGSIPAFVNRFIATNSDMFEDVLTYSGRFNDAMSTESYRISLMNIYISKNYKPVFELIFRMTFNAMFPDDLDWFTEEHELVYEITRNDQEQWKVSQHVDFDGHIDSLSVKDFFLLKSKITDSDIY